MQYSKQRLQTILSIVALLFMLAMIVGSILLFQQDKKTFQVNFYEDELLIATIEKDKDAGITKEEIQAINQRIPYYNDSYYYAWSYRKDTFIEVDFTAVHQNVSVYLFRFKNEFHIYVNESEAFTYEIVTDGPIHFGSNAVVKIYETIDTTKYHTEVFANHKPLEKGEDGTYFIEDIRSDIYIDVGFKERAQFEPVVLDSYVYTGESYTVDYELYTIDHESITTTDVEIKYYNASHQEVTGMKDAGIYEVVYHYVGNEYFVEDKIVKITIEKATPTIEVANQNKEYDGSNQGYSISDIVTNSDGKITFENNSYIEIGTYPVTIHIEETTNYQAKDVVVDIHIIKGVPEINTLPKASLGFENHTLKDVELRGGLATTKGHFEWVYPESELVEGKKEYDAIFVPDDLVHYEKVECKIIVETLSITETLRRIKIDRAEVFDDLALILKGNLSTIPNLPVKAAMYNSEITWLSNSSALVVDKQGIVQSIEEEGIYSITLVAYMMLGDAVEYATFTFNYEVKKTEKIVSLSREEKVPTLEEIGQTALQNKEEQSIKEEPYKEVELVTPTEETHIPTDMEIEAECSKENNLSVLEKQMQKFVYQAKCKRVRIISEVILWKIISDGANENNNIQTEINTKKISKFMKGERV